MQAQALASATNNIVTKDRAKTESSPSSKKPRIKHADPDLKMSLGNRQPTTSTRELQQLREIHQLRVRVASNEVRLTSNEEVIATLVSEKKKMAIEQSKLRSELEVVRSLLDQQGHNSSVPQSIQQAASKKKNKIKLQK